MCDDFVFAVSKCQRGWLGSRYIPDGHQSVAGNSWSICGTSPTVEPLWKHVTAACRTRNVAFIIITFFLLHGSMFSKCFLETETEAMLRKNSKLVVAQLEGAICFCLQSFASQEVISSLLKGKKKAEVIVQGCP